MRINYPFLVEEGEPYRCRMIGLLLRERFWEVNTTQNYQIVGGNQDERAITRHQ